MGKEKIKFLSLKHKNEIKKLKNYDTYKKAFEFCFAQQDINNIGVIGDYGTGKSTIINTYVDNDLDQTKYDVIRVSLLTLENKKTPNDDCLSSTDILKNMIKQIVHNPKKNLEYDILKFKPMTLKVREVFSILGFVLAFLLVFFANTNLISNISILSQLLDLNISIEAFRILKYLSLITIVLFFLRFIYPRLLSGIRIKKLKISTINAEVKRTTEDIINEESDYLEYLIYLLKRKKKLFKEKDLLLIIEDIDRFENINIFQQLREVNNILNEGSEQNYKFIYAVGNSLFFDTPNNNSICIKESYQSDFKDKAAKFFDFIINITPIMDNQNCYEFIKKEFPDIVEKSGIPEEDLFMISQYIDTPRVLLDVINDYQIMKDMRLNKDGDTKFNDLKLLYYSILKSKFHNFYKIIHEIFYDLEWIAKYYSNPDEHINIENKRKNDFIALYALYALNNNITSSLNRNKSEELWKMIKNESDIHKIMNTYGKFKAYNSVQTLNHILEFAKSENKEYIFSVDLYKKRIGASIAYNSQSFLQLLSNYYTNKNDVITEIIKHVENQRYNDLNKTTFSIKEFLDIDFVKLGILEGLLDINDYNIYISQNYLEVNDAEYIRQFNLNIDDSDMFTIMLFDVDAVLSKIKLEKIQNLNGLNVYIIAHIQIDKIRNNKAKIINENAINMDLFMYELLNFEFSGREFNKITFLILNADKIHDDKSFNVIINWLDNEYNESYYLEEKAITKFLDELSDTFKFSILDTDYCLPIYSLLLESKNLIKDEKTLVFLLNKISEELRQEENNEEESVELVNIILEEYRIMVLEDEEFDNIEWLTCFNDNIGEFISLINNDKIDIVQSVYQEIGTIKVEQLCILSNSDFLSTIYEYNLYEYTDENINYLSERFTDEDITNFSPFAEYSFENLELLKYYISNNQIPILDINKEWSKKLIFTLLNKTPDVNFAKLLNFFSSENPIVIQDISELSLNMKKLVVFIENLNLYANTYSNLHYIYNALSETKTQKTDLLLILESENFDYSTLYNDKKDFDENADLKGLIYKGLFKNQNISLSLFKKFMDEYKSILDNGKLLSSQDKVKAMFELEILEMNIDNLLLCEAPTLGFLYTQRYKDFYAALSELSEEQIIEVLKIFNNKEQEINCLVNFYNCVKIDFNFYQDLTVSYLREFRFTDDKDEFENTSLKLLNPFKDKSKDIRKIIELLENGKGQRTISMDISEIVDLFKDKQVISYSKFEDQLRLHYNDFYQQ